MSKKRFTFDYEVEFEIFDRVTKKHYDGTVGCQEKICDLLNEQSERIKSLEMELDLIANTKLFSRRKLEEENEQLKQEIKQYWKCRDKWKQEAKELKEENEQLRKQCFELEKDYLIETSDISDKIYLKDEIKELKQRYGVGDE